MKRSTPESFLQEWLFSVKMHPSSHWRVWKRRLKVTVDEIASASRCIRCPDMLCIQTMSPPDTRVMQEPGLDTQDKITPHEKHYNHVGKRHAATVLKDVFFIFSISYYLMSFHDMVYSLAQGLRTKSPRRASENSRCELNR